MYFFERHSDREKQRHMEIQRKRERRWEGGKKRKMEREKREGGRKMFEGMVQRETMRERKVEWRRNRDTVQLYSPSSCKT